MLGRTVCGFPAVMLRLGAGEANETFGSVNA